MNTKKHTEEKLSLLSELLQLLLSYRSGMRVTETEVFHSPIYGKTEFYLCPRCHTPLERDFQAYCDRCGQHLDW